MTLYLVQHAEPKPKEEYPERHLSEKGRRDIKEVAAFVTEHINIQTRNIFHSGKARARETAEVLGEHLSPVEGVQEAEGLDPLADPALWVERLDELQDDIMLVGHLPHMGKLSALLLCQDENRNIVNFQMGGVVCLDKNEEGIWSIRWMVVPEILSI